MNRRKNNDERVRSRELGFSEMRSSVDEVEIAFGNLGRVLDVEFDQFDKFMLDIRYILHLWQSKLLETDGALEQVLKNKFLGRVKEVHSLFCSCEGRNDIESRRTEAMDLIQDIPLNTLGEIEVMMDNTPIWWSVEIIARPMELDEIAGMLVRDNIFPNPSTSVIVFPIIGKPGSGKTSLVYHLFHHQITRKHFDKRIWLRWEDISGVSSRDEILRIVEQTFYSSLKVGTHAIDFDAKTLIVLDGFSTEDALLKPLLSTIAITHGTKILVTFNSTSFEPHVLLQLPIVLAAPYQLEPLSHDDTLAFFQSILAFKRIAEADMNTSRPMFHEILNKCANNLRVIRIIAFILSSQPYPVIWELFIAVVLDIPNPVEHILSVVDRMQQQHLQYYLLFPFLHEFIKEELYPLWDVQQQFSDTSKEMFETLLANDFLFKCGGRDKSGVIVSYKIRYLVHLVAKHLARDKCFQVQFWTYEKELKFDRIEHLSLLIGWYLIAPPWIHHPKYLKSLLLCHDIYGEKATITCDLNKMLKDLKVLGALDLAIINCRNYLDHIGQLSHLRYLRLGVSSESLPECITNLKYLQTLDLRHSKVRQLPENFHKMRSLRHLYFGKRLIDLPPRFGELTGLHTLDVFIVGQHNGLDALANFPHLAGNLNIRYHKGREVHVLQEDIKVLEDKKLHELLLEWPSSNAEPVAEIYQKEDANELELLQPPSTLKILTVKNWKGDRFPQWAINHFSSLLSNLVFIHIADCSQCKHLPSFSKLGCLKFLELWGLIVLEWIEISDDNSMVTSETPYFPSLEHLSLLNLPMLKGWSRLPRVVDNQYCSCPIIPRVHDLKVSSCPELISLPLMPNLKTLEANNCHGDFLQQFLSAHASQQSSSSASPALPLFQNLCSLNLTNMSIPECLVCLTTLEDLSLCWLYDMRILPESIGHLIQLHRLVIRYLPNLVDLPESLAGLSALEHVEIRYCPRLKQVPNFFPNLKSLKRLEIKECVNLERRCRKPDGEDCPLIQYIPNVNLG